MVVYALGSNGSGQLGIGHIEDVSVPTVHLQSLKSAKGKGTPVKIVGGGNHTLIRYSSGQVCTTGSVDARMHRANAVSNPDSTHTILLAEDVELCAATWEASILWTRSGILTTFGKGEKGELGRGPKVTEIDAGDASRLSITSSLAQGLSLVDIASGVHHTVVVMSDGSVFGWGNGRKGQLGEPLEVVWHPRKILGLNFKVLKAVCGREFTYLAGDQGQGQHIVLGKDKWRFKLDAPSDIRGWREIGACWGSIFVLLESGNIISWGRDDHGQLAPEGLPPIRSMANGSEHSLALTFDGRVVAWGWGEHGNCGPELDASGDVKHRWNLLSLPSESGGQALGIGAGCATSWIWD